ncbi:MAG: ribose 5-phosphate isomerase B [Anaerolineaceae bacterium]|nr:ribose 5-phosphate isomerase B [Anaerolineaceae bacterium]
MRIAISSDHGGLPLKDAVISAVKKLGHEALDLGTFTDASVDYPDFSEKVGQALLEKRADRGIVICGSGVGACIAANKMKGIYAAICHDTYSARQGVEHDNMNVLCLGGRVIGPELAGELVGAFLSAIFLNKGNYLRRVEKVQKMEDHF